VEIPSIEYAEALKLQYSIVAARYNKIISTDVVLMVEHPPVFTVGRRGGQENLVVSEAVLKKLGIPVVQTERGGNITYHGPGQLVVYPIIDLREAKLKVADYVTRLEEVMIRTAAEWGIRAERNSLSRGIWVGRNKLGSIGIAIRHGISFHGFALNVNTSLIPFEWVHPCGLQDIAMTSMKCELSRQASMHQVRASVKRHMQEVFNVESRMESLSAVRGLMKIPA
jgi:lipoate-protein ligase B